MSNFSAAIPVAQMQAANEALDAQGFGPNNFSVPAYAGPTASIAMLHSWHYPAFEAAVTAIPGVVIQQGGEPVVMTSALAASQGVAWFKDAQFLTGLVTPGLYVDADRIFWYVIQPYDTAVWPDPFVIPALIRIAKIPGAVIPWQQPLDQFDAYKLVNPFTGEGDFCSHNGDTWQVTQADGAGNNVWEPGAFGWTIVGQVPLDYITYEGDPVFYAGQGVTNG